MYLKLNLENVTHGYILVPSDKVGYLAEVIKLFETNTVWMNDGYNTRKVAECKIEAHLGDEVKFEADTYYPEKVEMSISLGEMKSGAIVTTSLDEVKSIFVDIDANNKKWKKLVEDEKDKAKLLQSEIDFLKAKIKNMGCNDE